MMGEIHCSRVNPRFWREELEKIKAGGVSIVSSYVIWIHHEEIEGEFDFSGCRDLRRFLRECTQAGLYVFLRLGPWVHGEVRNGGFPDWLLTKENVTPRTNDPAYFSFVRCFWEQVMRQADGLLWKDGGPVIGIQIENEYGHAGGLRGAEGERHMRELKSLACGLGFDVPLYTATGWGGACTGGMLPVMGGYCEAPWEQHVRELPANVNYVFSKIRNDALIASDHAAGDSVTFDESRFPYLTAELGGGLQVTKHRRPIAMGADIGAMSIAKLGSGVGLLGYYMYHGGSNPKGRRTTLQESRETGYANDYPEINYDFNAPIRQFGTISDTYRELRLLGLFLQDFGSDLAALPAEILTDNVRPEDTHTLRLSCRHDDTHGYLFFNNYQRRRTMDSHPDMVLTGRCKAGDVAFPPVHIASGEYGFFPYNMVLGKAVLRCAAATPLCRLQTEQGEVFVFYADRAPEFTWESETRAEVLCLTRAQALKACKVRLKQDHLLIADDFVWEDCGKLTVTGSDSAVLNVFPPLPHPPEHFTGCGTENGWGIYSHIPTGAHIGVSYRQTAADGEYSTYEINIEYKGIPDADDFLDAVLSIETFCESMAIYYEGNKCNDWFYTGQPMLFSLRAFDFPETLTAVVHTMRPEDREKIYLETWQEFPADVHGEILSIAAQESFSSVTEYSRRGE